MLIKNENAIGILVKTTLIDFPGLVASTIFLPGCNLGCPYCYNAELAKGIVPEENSVSLNELYEHLKKRKNVISGLVISGGEALLNPHLKEIILTAKAFGYKIKLDTNGTLPKKLEEIISSNDTKPDFIAMDIKTSPLKYEEKITAAANLCPVSEKIAESVKIISKYPAEKREFRTVLVPSIIEKKDIEEISSILPSDAEWNFSRFANENCLNPDFCKIAPYTDEESEEFVKIARRRIPNAKIR